MVSSSEQDGSKTYQLTDAGQAEAAAVPTMPWESAEGRTIIRHLRHSMGQLMMAAKQLSGAGDESTSTRHRHHPQPPGEIYRLLAED